MDSFIFQPKSVAHPGELVLDYLEYHGWTQSDLSRRTGISSKTISEICNGKASISPSTSIALERVFQRPAHFWLNMQGRYDEAEARARDFANNATWIEWAKKFPVKEMKKRKWLPDSGSEGSDTNALLRFLSVSSPESWNTVWGAAQVAYRQTRKFETSAEAMAVWVRRVELEAEEIDVSDFEESKLRLSLDSLRRLTRTPIDEALTSAANICRQSGVALVLVPELPKTGISGCAHWANDKHAIIALTLRYKHDDQIWFTFFHELGHILLHRRKHGLIVDNAEDTLTDGIVDPDMQRLEEEANRFSSDTLLPSSLFQTFVMKGSFSNESIHSFSERIGVGPGIVVGRLQHEGLLKPHQGNALKQRIEWSI
ncbi:MAG: HigA family addiction module antitoxin [Fibrobacteria bacterium]